MVSRGAVTASGKPLADIHLVELFRAQQLLLPRTPRTPSSLLALEHACLAPYMISVFVMMVRQASS
jgi:hypothetical protein